MKYTVVVIPSDTDDAFTRHVEADSVAAAQRLAVAFTPYENDVPCLCAAVFHGHLDNLLLKH